MTSYIPYTSFTSSSLASRQPDIAFHLAFWEVAQHRIGRHMAETFANLTVGKRLFLLRILRNLGEHKRTFRAHTIVLEAFGAPLYIMRNLAHTPRDPENRMVYILHIEDLYQRWRQQVDACWWQGDWLWCVVFLGLFLGIALAALMQPASPLASPFPLTNLHRNRLAFGDPLHM